MAITAQELLARIDAHDAPTIVDVRSQEEYAAGHVPGAIHIPFTAVRRRASEIPGAPGDPIVVYCGHGPRAWIAGSSLRRLGFRKVIYLSGHWSSWHKAGLREEK